MKINKFPKGKVVSRAKIILGGVAEDRPGKVWRINSFSVACSLDLNYGGLRMRALRLLDELSGKPCAAVRW